MDAIFISYRREDSAPYAGRLYDFLRINLPNRKVFMDIDAIEPGEDFIEAINRTLDSSRVVLAIIGRAWISCNDVSGNRRLDNPDDYVVLELSIALASDARVIPVLVGGAVMPRTDALPDSLMLLARRNAIELSDNRFTSDAERLIYAISSIFESVHIEPVQQEKTSKINSSTITKGILENQKLLLISSFLTIIVSILIANVILLAAGLILFGMWIYNKSKGRNNWGQRE